MTVPNETTMQRLAFIKSMYNVGVEQSQQPELQAAMAILTFHDSVELFLLLAAEHLNVDLSKKNTFAEYFGEIGKNRGKIFEQQRGMQVLNEARVKLKHSGLFPRQDDIDRLRFHTNEFFENNTPELFGIAFSTISMVALVHDAVAHALLKEAEGLMMSEMWDEAIAKITPAFDKLLNEYRGVSRDLTPSLYFGGDVQQVQKAWDEERRDPLNFGHRDSVWMKVAHDTEMTRIYQALAVLAIGMDYHKYIQFRQFTSATVTIAYEEGVRQEVQPPAVQPAGMTCQFCFDFVIDSALRIQEALSRLKGN